MLVSNDNARVALLPLANALMTEVRAFGRLSMNDCLDYEFPSRLAGVRTYIERRRIPISRILLSLEQRAGLRFTGETIPYRFNMGTWPEGLPLAGYFSPDQALSPFLFLQTTFSNWLLDCECSTQTRFVFICRSALSMVLQQGMAAAMSYLLAMVEHGYITDSGTAATVIVYLLAARSQSPSDQDMVERLIIGSVPQTQQEWLEIRLTFQWIDLHHYSDEMRAVEMQLIEQCLLKVEQVRNASDLDTWITGYASLSGMGWLIILLLRHTYKQAPLGLRTISTLLEEIGADYPVTLMNLGGTFAGMVDYARGLAHIYRRSVGLQWRKRLAQERLLLPSCLLPLLEEDNRDTLAPEWIRPSWQLGHPWTYLHAVAKEDPAFVRSNYAFGEPMTMHGPTQHPDDGQCMQEATDGIYTALDLIAQSNITDELTHTHRLQQRYPWHAGVSLILAMAYSSIQEPTRAIEYNVQAIALNPYNQEAWEHLIQLLQATGNTQEATLAAGLAQELNDLEQAGYK